MLFRFFRFWGFFALMILLFSSANQPCTGEEICFFQLLRGNAEVQKKSAGNWEAIGNEKSPVTPGDKLKTGVETRAELIFPDSSVIRLKSETILQLHPDGVQLQVGDSFFQMQRQGRSFQVVTPSSVCGVLGTMFDVNVNPYGQTRVRVFQGSVAVRNHQDRGQRQVLLKAGQQVEGNMNKPLPTQPLMFNPEKTIKEDWIQISPTTRDPKSCINQVPGLPQGLPKPAIDPLFPQPGQPGQLPMAPPPGSPWSPPSWDKPEQASPQPGQPGMPPAPFDPRYPGNNGPFPQAWGPGQSPPRQMGDSTHPRGATPPPAFGGQGANNQFPAPPQGLRPQPPGANPSGRPQMFPQPGSAGGAQSGQPRTLPNPSDPRQAGPSGPLPPPIGSRPPPSGGAPPGQTPPPAAQPGPTGNPQPGQPGMPPKPPPPGAVQPGQTPPSPQPGLPPRPPPGGPLPPLPPRR